MLCYLSQNFNIGIHWIHAAFYTIRNFLKTGYSILWWNKEIKMRSLYGNKLLSKQK